MKWLHWAPALVGVLAGLAIAEFRSDGRETPDAGWGRSPAMRSDAEGANAPRHLAKRGFDRRAERDSRTAADDTWDEYRNADAFERWADDEEEAYSERFHNNRRDFDVAYERDEDQQLAAGPHGHGPRGFGPHGFGPHRSGPSGFGGSRFHTAAREDSDRRGGDHPASHRHVSWKHDDDDGCAHCRHRHGAGGRQFASRGFGGHSAMRGHSERGHGMCRHCMSDHGKDRHGMRGHGMCGHGSCGWGQKHGGWSHGGGHRHGMHRGMSGWNHRGGGCPHCRHGFGGHGFGGHGFGRHGFGGHGFGTHRFGSHRCGKGGCGHHAGHGHWRRPHGSMAAHGWGLIDSDKDGKISKDEVLKRFGEIDADNDGLITKDEIGTHIRKQIENRMRQWRDAAKKAHEQRHPKAGDAAKPDAKKDDKKPDEPKKDEPKKDAGEKQTGNDERSPRFAGRFGAGGPGGPGGFGGPHGFGPRGFGPGVGPGFGPPSHEQLMSRFDANRDGALSKEELPEPLWDRLAAADKDRSGSLSASELKHLEPGPGGRPERRADDVNRDRTERDETKSDQPKPAEPKSQESKESPTQSGPAVADVPST